MPPQAFPRVLIGDDHALVAQAIKQLLQPEFNVVGIATDGRQLLQKASELCPDVTLVDIEMPLLNGLDAGRRILEARPSTKVIYLTMSDDPEVANEAIAHGASAFLQKTIGRRELCHAIAKALKMDSPCNETNGNGASMLESDKFDQALNLTARQRDVLQLLAEGLSMKQVAGVLNLATRTVAFHKYRIMETLGLGNDAELVQFAVRNHIVFVNEVAQGHAEKARSRNQAA